MPAHPFRTALAVSAAAPLMLTVGAATASAEVSIGGLGTFVDDSGAVVTYISYGSAIDCTAHATTRNNQTVEGTFVESFGGFFHWYDLKPGRYLITVDCGEDGTDSAHTVVRGHYATS